jgi:hypothetical protein
MNGHGFAAALMKSYDAKVSTFLKVEVFKFGVTRVYCVVVESPSLMNVVPDSSNSVCGPRLAVALVSPSFGRF